MPNLYRILGIRPGARAERVKAAYRTLVKRYHPDVNADEKDAGHRIKDINRAYEVLRHPEERAAYDSELSRQRAERRRRFWRLVDTGGITCVFTAGIALVVVLALQPQKRPRQALSQVASLDVKVPFGGQPIVRSEPPRTLPESTDTDLPSEAAIAIPLIVPLPPPAAPRPGDDQTLPAIASDGPTLPKRSKPANWIVYQNARFGFSLNYPADVFTTATGSDVDGSERFLQSRDGQALLWISAMPNRPATTLAEYRRSLLQARYANAALDHVPVQGNWFVLSGTIGDEMFYERVTFSCDHRTVHRWLILYPVSERPYFDNIVEKINHSYRYDLGAPARCTGPRVEHAHARSAPAKVEAVVNPVDVH